MDRNAETGQVHFFQNAGLLLFLNMLASALNYVYQIILARVLSVDAFGTMYTVFSVMLVAAVPGSTFTMLCAKNISQCCAVNKREEAWQYARNQFWRANIMAAAILLLGIIIYRPLQIVLKINDIHVLLLLLLACALGYYHPLFSGCMSGMKRFSSLGIYALLIPCYKLLGLMIATLTNEERNKIYVILYSIIVGSILTALVGYLYLFYRLAEKRKISSPKLPLKEQGWMDSLVINICLAVYVNIDILAVRYIAGETVGGLYSAANLFGKMIYYCATSIGTVLLPVAATASVHEAKKILKRILLLVCAVSVPGLLLLNLIKKPLILFIYGEEYWAAAEYIAPVSLISFAIGMLTILINFFVGTARFKKARVSLLILTGCIFVLVLFVSDIQILLTLIGLSGIVCSVSFISSFFLQKT